MNTTYPIGALAEKIVAVTFRLDGTISPVFRRRQNDGRVIDASKRNPQRIQHSGPTEFVARVAPGHSGTVEMKYDIWEFQYPQGMIALGRAAPFIDQELGLPDKTTDNDVHAKESINPDEVWFHYVDGKLTWNSDHASGAAVVNQAFPELTVVLRLPPGNHGEISFASPLFTTADGEPASVLSVA